MKVRPVVVALVSSLFFVPALVRADDLTFKQFTVIREFGGADNAAIFGVLPSELGMKITDVTGPAFLGNAYLAMLNENNLNGFFAHSSTPMSAAEKQQLLSDYAGAYVIYFENYSGRLCSGDQYQIEMTGKIGGVTAVTRFDFIASPQSAGDCKFITLSEITMTSSHN
jgi:hypothetical protein